MFCGKLVKCLCVFALFGLATSKKIDVATLDRSLLHKPNFTSMDAFMQPFWDDSLCDDFEDGDTFINPENCQGLLICDGGRLWELYCDDGYLFDREF